MGNIGVGKYLDLKVIYPRPGYSENTRILGFPKGENSCGSLVVRIHLVCFRIAA